MYKDFDKNIKEEFIVLSHLKNEDSQKEKSSSFYSGDLISIWERIQTIDDIKKRSYKRRKKKTK